MGPVIIGDTPTAYWIQELNLVRIELQEGAQLTDKHMDASISVLAKQFPEMPAPQSTLLTQNLTLLRRPINVFPQLQWTLGVVFT